MASPAPKLRGPEIGAISFGCYGTLIDRAAGLRRALEEEGVLDSIPEPWSEFSARLIRWERDLQSGPFRTSREILAICLTQSARELDVTFDERTALTFADSVRRWDPCPDAVSALRRLGTRWPLMLLSNADRIYLSHALERLGVPFSETVTSEDVRAFKPTPSHFEEAQQRLPKRGGALLHVAATRETDVEPAASMGIECVWVNREDEAFSNLSEEVSARTTAIPGLEELVRLLGV